MDQRIDQETADAIVRARRADVVLQHDRTPFRRLDDARVVIARFVDLFPLRISCRYVIFSVSFETKMRRATDGAIAGAPF